MRQAHKLRPVMVIRIAIPPFYFVPTINLFPPSGNYISAKFAPIRYGVKTELAESEKQGQTTGFSIRFCHTVPMA